MKKIIALFIFFSTFFSAQVLEEFPNKQSFYLGGESAFYKKINDIWKENKFQPCENKKEVYQGKLLLTKDAIIKFVTDFDSLKIKQNKCAYDLTLKTLKILKNDTNWQSAIVKGEKYDSVVDFIIFPDDFFDHYKSGYNPYNLAIPATYIGGKNKFDKDFHDNFMTIFEDYHINGSFYLDFTINEEGNAINPYITPNIDNKTFTNEVFRTLKRMDGKWNPATINNIPIKQHFSVPIKFSIEFKER